MPPLSDLRPFHEGANLAFCDIVALAMEYSQALARICAAYEADDCVEASSLYVIAKAVSLPRGATATGQEVVLSEDALFASPVPVVHWPASRE